MAGGLNGNPWKPGDPDISLIIKKLKGKEGARMPLRKPALSAEVIGKFEKWIAEGAAFDGPDPSQTIAELAAVTRANLVTPDQLSIDRQEGAVRQWRLANPSEKPLTRETKNFYVMGNVPQGQIDEVAETAEVQAAAVAKLLHARWMRR